MGDGYLLTSFESKKTSRGKGGIARDYAGVVGMICVRIGSESDTGEKKREKLQRRQARRGEGRAWSGIY